MRPADCGGDGSARLVLFVESQHLGLELLPSERGYVFVNTVPPSGRPAEGLPISGDVGYFSSDEQQVCLRLAEGARFGMRKYLRPPPGTASYGPRGRRSLTFGEGDRPCAAIAIATPTGSSRARCRARPCRPTASARAPAAEPVELGERELDRTLELLDRGVADAASRRSRG